MQIITFKIKWYKYRKRSKKHLIQFVIYFWLERKWLLQTWSRKKLLCFNERYLHTQYVYVYVLVAQSCLTLWSPMDYSLPGFSVHGILQAKILEGVDIPFSRGSSQCRNQTWVSCIAGRFLYHLSYKHHT